MNRSIHLAFLLVLLAASAGAQTRQDSLDLLKDLDTYQRVSLRLDYDSLLYFMPPETFDIVTKEDIEGQLRAAFESDRIAIRFESFKFNTIPYVGKTGNHLYATVPYEAAITMTLADTSDAATVGMILMAMKVQFGSANVTQQPDKSMLIKTPDKQMIAVKSPGYTSWKFIEDKRKTPAPGDEEIQEFIDMVLPKEVLEATRQKE